MPVAAAQNNSDSRPVLDLAKFTDVPALLAAVRKARTDAAALPKSGADRPHIEKAIESLNAALSDSFTANNIDNLFQNVRQAVSSLETVKGPKVAAQKIAGNLTEAIRVAVEKFLGHVERAIPRLSDTKTRENATKDLAKSKDDYARGVAAISTRRTAAINHFHQAMKRMVEYPLKSSIIVRVVSSVSRFTADTTALGAVRTPEEIINNFTSIFSVDNLFNGEIFRFTAGDTSYLVRVFFSASRQFVALDVRNGLSSSLALYRNGGLITVYHFDQDSQVHRIVLSNNGDLAVFVRLSEALEPNQLLMIPKEGGIHAITFGSMAPYGGAVNEIFSLDASKFLFSYRTMSDITHELAVHLVCLSSFGNILWQNEIAVGTSLVVDCIKIGVPESSNVVLASIYFGEATKGRIYTFDLTDGILKYTSADFNFSAFHITRADNADYVIAGIGGLGRISGNQALVWQRTDSLVYWNPFVFSNMIFVLRTAPGSTIHGRVPAFLEISSSENGNRLIELPLGMIRPDELMLRVEQVFGTNEYLIRSSGIAARIALE